MLIATLIKCCPFCAGRGLLSNLDGQSKFGVVCAGCLIRLPHKFQTAEEAIAAWCKRQGTVSAAGGRAGKGRSSWRKRRSSRRNLRTARLKKKLKWIARKADAIYAILKPFRDADLAEAEAAAAQSRAELKELEPRIMKYPKLAQFYREFILKEKPVPAGTYAKTSM